MEYTERNDLKEKKEEELLELLLKDVEHPQKIFSELKSTYSITISAPLEPKPMMELMTQDRLGNTSSIKPGNIRLNIANLIFSAPAAITAGFGVMEDNLVLKVCAFLLVWKELRDCMTVEVDADEANVMIALWRNCNSRHQISVTDGLRALNDYLISKHQNPIDNFNYQKSLDKLITMESIEIDDDVIWLREWVSQKYSS